MNSYFPIFLTIPITWRPGIEETTRKKDYNLVAFIFCFNIAVTLHKLLISSHIVNELVSRNTK